MFIRSVTLAAIALCLFSTDSMGQRASGPNAINVGDRTTRRGRTIRRQTHLPAQQYPILPEDQSSAALSNHSSDEVELPQAAVEPATFEYPEYRKQCQQPPQPIAWARAEYLLWWTKGIDVPALASTSVGGTAQADAGVLGLPTTEVLFGDTDFATASRSGGRFSLGFWLDPCHCTALDITYTTLGNERESFSGSDSSLAILTRPFFNTQNNAEESHLVAFPDVVSGSLDVTLSSEFQTFEILFRRKLERGPGSSLEYLWGYRYAELNDGLRLSESTLLLSPAAQGATISLFDQFETANEFHGGQFGFVKQWQSAPCVVSELVAKVALGSTQSNVGVSGETTSTVGGSSNLSGVGLLAQASNIGQREEQSFSAIAEVGFNLRRRFTPRVVGTFGYTFMYWSEVARVGDQLDLAINTSQIPPGSLSGEARPAPRLDTTSFWAQGISVGLEAAF